VFFQGCNLAFWQSIHCVLFQQIGGRMEMK
jgi:hypothetical protein